MKKSVCHFYCRIDGALNIKVADNALSRDLFPNDYHCLGDNENRPVKWLAIESLVYRTFSTASDVVSLYSYITFNWISLELICII